MTTIVRDEDIRSGDPRVEGTRITVFDVKRRVIDNGEDPHIVAGEYELSMVELFRALTYYYEHRDDLAADERAAVAARKEGEQQTRDLVDSDGRIESDSREQVD